MKLKFLKTIFLSLLVLTSKIYCDETQYWNEFKVSEKIDDRWVLEAQSAFRWRNKGGQLFEKYIQMSLGYRIAPSLWVSPGYRHGKSLTVKEDGSSSWKRYRTALLDIKKSWKWNVFDFSARNRFMYRSNSKFWLLRERIKIAYPIKLCCFELTPFVSEELFFEKFREYNQNRLKLGFEFPIYSELTGSLSYVQRRDKSVRGWTLKHVLNTELNFTF